MTATQPGNETNLAVAATAWYQTYECINLLVSFFFTIFKT